MTRRMSMTRRRPQTARGRTARTISLRRMQKMSKTFWLGQGLRRLMAAMLAALLAFALLPAPALAFGAVPASSWYGDTVTGSDGRAYYHPAPWSYMQYHQDGTVSYHTSLGGTPYRHFMLTDADGSSRWVYCVESGIAFNDASSVYTSSSGADSAYLNRLPAASRYGIKIASLYGWHPGAALPVSGINADDWSMATQVILWEYQQQLRSDPLSRHSNGIVGANQFYNIIAGHPAERAYVWMLGKIASHSVAPSFTAAAASAAPVHELKWDVTDKVYRLVLTDTNNLNIDFERLSGTGVTVTRDGNRYTFTSTRMISEPVTFNYRKDIPVVDRLLIWGRPGYQTMLTGAEDPVSFSMKIKTETFGTARIIKTSEDGAVQGISFRITGTDILGQGVDVTVTTGAGGVVDRQLLPGTYLVQEVKTDRYVTPAPQHVTIESGQTASVSFHNVLKKFRVHLVKADADTGTAQGDGTLAGARYGLYLAGELIDIYTTDADGSFLTRYYVCSDDWTLRELAPSEGYLLDDTTHEVGAAPGLYEVELNTADVRVGEQSISGAIRLIKHTDDADPDVAAGEHSTDGNAGQAEVPEAGATFEVYLSAAGSYEGAKPGERDLLVTDADGMATSKPLPYGRYTVHQASAGLAGKNKATVPDFTVYISEEGHTYSYILNNDSVTGRLRVEKRDAESGELVALFGAGFKVRDLNSGGFVTQTIHYPNPVSLDVFYTSDEGWLMLPDALPKNTGGYELIEVTAPFGYVLDSTPVPFRVDGDEAVITVVQSDMPQKARITITKTGEVLSSVEETDGTFQPVYGVWGLPGAVYDIVADADITGGDGTIHAAKDSVVQTITTGPDAVATSGELYLGRYRLIERQAPYGMVANTEPLFVELAWAGQEVAVYDASFGIYDERQKVAVSLIKSMEKDEAFGIGEGDEWASVSFGLFASFDIPALDGSVIPEDGLVEAVSVTPVPGASGRFSASFASDLPLASYYVKELSTDKHYVLDDTQHPVVFGYEGQETATVEIAVNDGDDIGNDLIRGKVTGIKYGEDRDGGDAVPLEGALIGLFFGDETDFSEERALLVATTDKDGSFSFEGIPFGHFVVREMKSPALYAVSGQFHHVYIGVDEQEVAIRIDDALIRGSVQLIKTEAVGETDEGPFMRRVAGASFELYADDDNDKMLTEADELLGTLEESEPGFHQISGLLASGYFVKEASAPEGYVIDEQAHYFAIEEDGQIVVIENGERGSGFVNGAYLGNLRILKDSSDGRKDGFTFEVTSKDGTWSKTFVTDTDGVIEVKGLRIGEYTVTELSTRASRGYLIPDAAVVEIKTGETITVSFFNEKPDEPEIPDEPKTPDVPKAPDAGKPVPQTSDDYRVVLWLALVGVALVGASVSVVFLCRKKRVALIPLALCVAAGVAGAFAATGEMKQYGEGTEVYAALECFVTSPSMSSLSAEAEPSEGEVSEDGAQAQADVPASVLPSADFAALQKINPDVVGWLSSEGTPIDYPVVRGGDNERYLRVLYDGTEGKYGTPFLDFESASDFSDRNSIIYGHNLLDGSMFSCLTEYRDQAYFEEHPAMLLLVPDGAYRMEVFSVFVASPTEAGTATSPWKQSWDADADFAAWLAQVKERSLIHSDVAPTAKDKVLTLSTCVNQGRERILVMGRLVPAT
jgi:SrtB family sortase